jgi:hypothetical protein
VSPLCHTHDQSMAREKVVDATDFAQWWILPCYGRRTCRQSGKLRALLFQMKRCGVALGIGGVIYRMLPRVRSVC